jgi:hypothetical protein
LIAVDTNVLVYAHRGELPQHRVARARVTELWEGDALWAIPVFCIGEFVRVVTHPRVFDAPHSVEEACRAIEHLLESASLRVLLPGERYWPLLAEALRQGDARGNLAFDAQIVALCREGGAASLLTADRDFARFAGLRIEPL